MGDLYKGYIKTKDKRAAEAFKDRSDFKTLDEVRYLPGYAGVLEKDTMFIDIDDPRQSEILMDIVEDLQLDCRVICTDRGKHFIFKNTRVHRCKTKETLACGLTADVKVGYVNAYEVLKMDGEERFCEWDIEPGAHYQEVPKWLLPIGKKKLDLIDMEAGDGRNQELFNYILTLQSNDLSVEEIRETIRIINDYVLKDPLSDQEVETILRDDAFKKPVFFNGPRFLFDRFAAYMKNTQHVVLIDGILHIYRDGVYLNGYRHIEAEMIRTIPELSDTKRKEVLKYMQLICDTVEPADARYIAFRNGIYDVVEDTLQDFSPSIVITNKIPWDYDPQAYSEIAERTLDRLSCGDRTIRALLEECIGYCFYRSNAYKKSFMFTGDKNNGKSTFLKLVKVIMGEDNISALDLKELGDRFSTSMVFGKLVNIGDDIGDDFLQGTQVAMFKKIVSGDRIKAERKGQDPFEFDPYVKLLFSANDIPRMKDKTGAVLDRLIIIPFNARFSKEDPDYDPFIGYKLIEPGSIGYLIKLGIMGLRRVLEGQGFTRSDLVDRQLEEYEEENNPIVAFIHDLEHGEDDIVNEAAADVYARYNVFCNAANMQPMSKGVFSKQINKRIGTEIAFRKIAGKTTRVFVRAKGR